VRLFVVHYLLLNQYSTHNLIHSHLEVEQLDNNLYDKSLQIHHHYFVILANISVICRITNITGMHTSTGTSANMAVSCIGSIHHIDVCGRGTNRPVL
jgi:hypothetical protein